MGGISRRDFIKLGVVASGSAVLAGCQTPSQWVTLEPYVRPPEEQLAGTATWYASTCRQCPAGCGIVTRIMNGRAKKIEGNGEHPLNQGKSCARGQAALQVLYDPDRLTSPARQSPRGTRQFAPISWNEGINSLFERVRAAGDHIAVWGNSTMSGHLYDLFSRLTGALGAPSPITFDLYTAYHGYALLRETSRRLFGRAALPSYDLGRADVVFSFGADLASTWLSAVRYGAEFGGLRSQELGKRGYLVQLEPKMSITGAKADRWLPIRPGAEGIVAQAIARIIADKSLGSTERASLARAFAGTTTVNEAAAASDLSASTLGELARIFAQAGRPLAIPGSTLTGQTNGADALAAVQSLNLIAGNVNAAGGMGLDAAPPLATLGKPLSSSWGDVQTQIERMRSGQVQVLLVHGANPAYDLPARSGFLDALKQVPYIVSFAPLVDETALWADLILPDRTPLEAWGYDVVAPSFGTPIVSSQQPVVVPVYDSRATADILLTIARGIPPAAKAMPWPDEVTYLKETVAALGAGSAGGSGTDVLWSRFLQHGGWWPSVPTGAPVASTPPASIQVGPTQYQGDEKDYPYHLHIFMNDLLSDGRGASQPWLQGSPDGMTTISWQTWVEINPQTAQPLGLKDGDVVTVTSPYGQIEAIVYTFPAIRPDTVAIPLGQGHGDLGRFARGRGSNPMELVDAKPDATGSDLTWATVRVRIAPTGRTAAVSAFESKVGVTEGFINQAFPGE